MALRAVPDHPKFADFKKRLGLNKACALGYLEALWHFAARYAPAGNIGKYQDSAIEAWVEWNGEPGALLRAFVDSHWGHDHDVHRIVIHDWPHHADDIVNTVLSRHCELFWDGTVPKAGRCNQRERERYHEWVESLGKKPRDPYRPKVRTEVESKPESVPVVREVISRRTPPSNGPSPTDQQLSEVEQGFNRHLKHNNREPKDLVIQNVLSMNGQFDWIKFRANHPGYCSHYDSTGWDFCKLSFLGWINAGMPPAPPKSDNQKRREEKNEW